MHTQGQEILKTNMQAIKSIINAVESCPMVWEPEESAVSTKKPQPICPEISLLLKDLIQLHLHNHMWVTMLKIFISHRPISTAHMNIKTGASGTRYSTQKKRLSWLHTTSCSCSSIRTTSTLIVMGEIDNEKRQRMQYLPPKPCQTLSCLFSASRTVMLESIGVKLFRKEGTDCGE